MDPSAGSVRRTMCKRSQNLLFSCQLQCWYWSQLCEILSCVEITLKMWWLGGKQKNKTCFENLRLNRRPICEKASGQFQTFTCILHLQNSLTSTSVHHCREFLFSLSDLFLNILSSSRIPPAFLHSFYASFLLLWGTIVPADKSQNVPAATKSSSMHHIHQWFMPEP